MNDLCVSGSKLPVGADGTIFHTDSAAANVMVANGANLIMNTSAIVVEIVHRMQVMNVT